MSKSRYPIVAPAFMIEQLNEAGLSPDDMEEFMPGIANGVFRLNKEQLVYPPRTKAEDEGFCAWSYNFDEADGKLYLSPDQPHYLKKGDTRPVFVWEGDLKKFVRARRKRK